LDNKSKIKFIAAAIIVALGFGIGYIGGFVIINGPTVSITIKSWMSIFFIAFLYVEFITISGSRVEFIRKVIIYLRARKYVNKIVPDWWKKHISFIAIHKNTLCEKSNRRYGNIEVYVKVTSKIDGGWTCDFMSFDKYGNFLESTLSEGIISHDSCMQLEIKEFVRDSSLSKLGI
jgi:hypothetical protein